MSLKILPHSQKHYDDTVAFAERRGLKDKFKEQVDRLADWAPDVECELYPDAPFSFGFLLQRIMPGATDQDLCMVRTESQKATLSHQRSSDYKAKTCAWCGIVMEHRALLFNGGLLYYGKGESGVAGPQFSVRLGVVDGDLQEGWEIHT